MNNFSRRSFLRSCSGAIGLASVSPVHQSYALSKNGSKVKPIKGSWFEFQHHNQPEGKYWNQTCASFSCKQWETKVKETAEIGMEYLVLMNTALYFKAFYDTTIFPKFEIGCDDPIEAILTAGDKYGVKFFIGGGFYGKWDSPGIISDPDAAKKRKIAIAELAERYSHHKSFYGWYWPNEAAINPYFKDHFIEYVNGCSEEARKYTPEAKTLIAPYGTRLAVPDDTFVKQLDTLDIDIIAYQDEVGVRKTQVHESAAFYEGLRKAHDRVSRAKMWADMEIFEFEGEVYRSALIPAAFSRIEKQLEAVSPYVDTILVYQYQGMMNKPDSEAFAGHPDSTVLYSDYVAWLNTFHPKMVKNL
ncbi:MAG: DUF4434 domain-containing protein [Candidatus Latescibacteria bacterium]|nr:DUF4434 domain-containing protein [Candidatus Latescibacterota bacterium]